MEEQRNFMPVYYQLAEDLKQQIESGILKQGDAVPSETQLVNEYGVSRVTVRRGLALLLKDGLIETIKGKGNFVAKPKLNQATISFTEQDFVSGNKVSYKLLQLKRIKAEGEIASRFNISDGSKIFMIKRLINGEKGPVGIDIKYLLYIKGKPLLENELEYADFPEIVARHTDVMIHKIERSISAAAILPEEAELLQVDIGHPVLCVTQIIYGKDGEGPLGISKTIYRGEAFEFKTVSYPYLGKM